MNPNTPESKLLVQIIDSGYDRKAWHGPNLRQSLRGVTARDAAWRPGPHRHNIWEIAVHCSYWKYVVRRKLTGDPRGSFSLEGSNWFKRPLAATEKAWREDRELLKREHHQLREAVRGILPTEARELPWSILYGVAFHDIYHAGQIRLLRRLQARA